MKRALFLLLYPVLLKAQVIPDNRRVDWSRVGLSREVAEPLIVLNVIEFGAKANGINDDSPSVIAAINSLNGLPGVIFFPAGTYFLNSPINLTDGVVLKGESASSTILNFNLSDDGNCINISKEQFNLFTPVITGFNKGSYSLTVADSIPVSVGDYMEIRQDNGSWDTKPALWAGHAVGQVLKIFAINGNEIFFESPLRIDYDSTLNIVCRRLEMISNCGVECMKIVRSDHNTGGNNINMQNAANSWVKGVESSYSNASHIELNMCSSCEISGCYIHDAFEYDGINTHGYGITMNNHTGECLIENNIFKHLRHSISVKHGANGNVVAYNYSNDPYRKEIPTDAGGDISLHGHYAYANLFEGNIVQTIHVDDAWGPSGPYNTFFRNRVELYGIIVTAAGTNQQNIVGNEITNFMFPYGNYAIGGQDHFLYANNFRGVLLPGHTDLLNEKSYYRVSSPAYWHHANWPSIGINAVLNSGTIPAKIRFVQDKQLTACIAAPTVITSISLNEKEANKIKIVPNPFSFGFSIYLNVDYSKSTFVELYDMMGKCLATLPVSITKGENIISPEIPLSLAAGFYFIKIEDQFYKVLKK